MLCGVPPLTSPPQLWNQCLSAHHLSSVTHQSSVLVQTKETFWIRQVLCLSVSLTAMDSLRLAAVCQRIKLSSSLQSFMTSSGVILHSHCQSTSHRKKRPITQPNKTSSSPFFFGLRSFSSASASPTSEPYKQHSPSKLNQQPSHQRHALSKSIMIRRGHATCALAIEGTLGGIPTINNIKPTKMGDRNILPDTFKPSHYDLAISKLEFKNWTYTGLLQYDLSPS